MADRFNLFGVRHLSPGASYHLIRYLEEKKPGCILIEGPSDARDILYSLAAKGVEPPVALLAYTTELPIETVLYPFSEYSPEFQAIRWGISHQKEVRFIDLPSDILLKLRQQQPTEEAKAFYSFHNGLYERLAAYYGESDYESYWERYFEHNLHYDSFRQGLQLQSTQLREMVEAAEQEVVPYDHSYNLIREAHMRREMARAVAEGYQPEEIVVIVGAYHLSGIAADLPPMSDEELREIPRANSLMTLMPYSYLRLSSRTGYGAGNRAPYYYEIVWKALQENRPESVPAIYLSRVAREMRAKGYNASPASVIEGVRLAHALSHMGEGAVAVLKDLHDAAVTCFGGGELSVVAEAINRVDIGTAIGSLPEGVSQTPVQEDMNQELKRLKLQPYKSAVAQELSLDLRENLKVKSQEAAFIDLNRSTFLHQLSLLGIHFAEQLKVSQESATWAEKWVLRWTPEVEIEVVEANLKGETIEIAVAYELKERLTHCTDISLAATVIRQACECNLVNLFDNAVSTLQALLVESASFKEVATAARELSLLTQYGDIRRFDLAPLLPVLQQLFLRASLLLVEACTCDDKAANEIIPAINRMELISQEQYETVDTTTWQKELSHLAWRDDLNARLSGVAFSILLEHNLVTEEECAKEVSRRLSPGIPADIGAGWFEGLAGRNRYALLSRVSLWKELDLYVQGLEEEEFFRSVVFLRRAFGSFEPQQKNSIAELLGNLWGTGAESTAERLQSELTEEESHKLDELNDFNFDF